MEHVNQDIIDFVNSIELNPEIIPDEPPILIHSNNVSNNETSLTQSINNIRLLFTSSTTSTRSGDNFVVTSADFELNDSLIKYLNGVTDNLFTLIHIYYVLYNHPSYERTLDEIKDHIEYLVLNYSRLNKDILTTLLYDINTAFSDINTNENIIINNLFIKYRLELINKLTSINIDIFNIRNNIITLILQEFNLFISKLMNRFYLRNDCQCRFCTLHDSDDEFGIEYHD